MLDEILLLGPSEWGFEDILRRTAEDTAEDILRSRIYDKLHTEDIKLYVTIFFYLKGRYPKCIF